jgi:DNA-binding transcriptional LysR family regulator
MKHYFMMGSRLQGLEIFVSVAQERGFSAAARKLGVSPSAVSQAVRALERRVGATLLVRTTRSVNLTEAGQQLFARVAPALNDASAALNDLTQSRGKVKGTLRLTVGRVALPQIVEPVLPLLLAEHPELTVEVSVDDRVVDIVAQGFDAGIRLEEAIEPDLGAARLAEPFRFVVVGAPSYFSRCGRPEQPKDLIHHDCIGFRKSSGYLYRWEFERGQREEAVAVQGRLVCNDAALMLHSAVQGLGLAYLMEPQVGPLLARGELEIVLEDYAPRVPGWFLCFARGAERQPKLRAFIDAARQVLSPKGRRSRPSRR